MTEKSLLEIKAFVRIAGTLTNEELEDSFTRLYKTVRARENSAKRDPGNASRAARVNGSLGGRPEKKALISFVADDGTIFKRSVPSESTFKYINIVAERLKLEESENCKILDYFELD